MDYKKNFYKLESNEKVFNGIKNEVNDIGYFNLPKQNLDEILKFSKNVKHNNIAVIGIGGSALGPSAIYDFLKSKVEFTKKLYFFDSTDPNDIKNKLYNLELADTLFIVISKSGTTIETISIFKYISSLIEINKNNCVVISEHDSKLTSFANKNQIKCFKIPKNVGGRFSVFSPVGLVPLSIIGIDIKKMLDSALKVNNSFFKKGVFHNIIMQKARFFAENKNKYNINVLFSYSSSLEGFNKWYVQLWGESLGKIANNGIRQGLTPIGLLGPVDQHSFLQLIMEGKRDKTVMFIKVDDFEEKTTIPEKTICGFSELEYLDNLKFEDLINQQADSIIESVNELKDVPIDVVTIDKIDEYNIAMLMQSFMILTSVVGKFLQIDTYNQPGVERGKIILKNKLKVK